MRKRFFEKNSRNALLVAAKTFSNRASHKSHNPFSLPPSDLQQRLSRSHGQMSKAV
jgi:hypothetical protein